MDDMVLERKCSDLQHDCLVRIRGVESHIESIKRTIVNDNGSLNDLGEFQSLVNMLDCRIASLATLRVLRGKVGDDDA